ncbi:MAG: Flp family type IVb pilin [Alphaproteobacteria bacterium]
MVNLITNFPAWVRSDSKRFQAEIHGATAVEYALLAGSLALSIIVGVAIIGDAAVELLSIPTEHFEEASE